MAAGKKKKRKYTRRVQEPVHLTAQQRAQLLEPHHRPETIRHGNYLAERDGAVREALLTIKTALERVFLLGKMAGVNELSERMKEEFAKAGKG